MSSSINSLRSFEPSYSSTMPQASTSQAGPRIRPSQDASLEYVSSQLAELEFPEAIDALFRFLAFMSEKSSKKISREDLDKAYQFIFTLLEHFTDENWKHFEREGGLDVFLSASKTMAGEQGRLCYEIGKKHEKKAKEKTEQTQKSNSDFTLKHLISSYDSSLLYYSKAVSILEAAGSHTYPGLLEQVFDSISAIFVEIIKCRLSGSFSKAVGKASIEQFRAALKEIENLKQFCTHNSQLESIYIIAADTITHIQNSQTRGEFTENFAYISDKIYEHRSTAPELFSNNIVERYRETLKNFRQNFEQNIENVRAFQNGLMEKFKSFFKEVFIKDTLAILGTPPCNYAICAMGSIGKEEMCPYSDLEYFILIEEDKTLTREYFENFAVILRLQLILLDETPGLQLVFKSLQDTNASGFKIDEGGNPADENRLIGTDSQFIKIITPEAVSPNRIENTLLKFANLYASDENFFAAYQTYFEKWLNHPEPTLSVGLKLREQIGLNLMKERLSASKELLHSNPLALQKPINVKENFLEPISHLMRDLSIYFGCPSANSSDIIDFFVDKKIFGITSGYIIKEALSDLYKIRIRLHQRSRCQNETWDPSIASQDAVGAQEKKSLERIYSLAFRPLYLSLEKALSDLATFGEAFDKLDLVKEGFKELSEKGVKSVHSLFVKAAVETLIDRGASEAAHTHLYEYLSSLSSTESLKGIYLQVLDNANFELANTLANIPSQDGYKQSYIRREKALQRAIENLTTEEDTGVQIHWGAQNTKRFIKKESIEEILDANGDIKDMYSKSMHHVARTPGQKSLHFKQFPSHPLREYAIGNLYARLAGLLTPAVELAGFTVRSNGIVKEYPVLISQTIEGQNLKDVFGSGTDALGQSFDWDQWTSMLLCSILSMPGDGRLPNFILDAQNKVWCIDNDISFVEPVTQERFFGRKINFCSALFCLFQTKPLSQKALENFCSFDTGVLLSSWLLDMIKKDKECQTLFTSEQRKAWLERENSCKLSFLIREGTATTLNLQFWRLQTYIKSSLNKKQPVTPLDLLEQIISLRKDKTLENPSGLFIASIYRRSAQKKASVEQILSNILGRSVEQSATSSQSDMASFDRPPTLQEIEERSLFSPEKAREELLVAMISQVVSEDRENVYTGNRNKTEVLQGSFKGLSEKRQVIVLQSLGHFISRSPAKPKVVILHHCDMLDSISLPPFLHKDLEYLSLRYCKKIKGLDFELITRLCPHLKELHVVNCSAVERVQALPLLGGLVSFSRLEVLRVSSCKSLVEICVATQNLKTLMLRNNLGLSGIDCAFIPVHKINFGWSPRLTKHVLREFSKKYSVSNCDLMLKGEFSLKHIWVLFFENNNNDFFEEKLEFLINNGFKFGGTHEFASVIESLVEISRKDIVQKIVERYEEIDRYEKDIEGILLKAIKATDVDLIEAVLSKDSLIKTGDERLLFCISASVNINNLLCVCIFLLKCSEPVAKSIIYKMLPVAISLQYEEIVNLFIEGVEELEMDMDWISPSLTKALEVGHSGFIDRLTKKISLIKTVDNQLAILTAALRFNKKEEILSSILDELINFDQKITNIPLDSIDFEDQEDKHRVSLFLWDAHLLPIVRTSSRFLSIGTFHNYIKLVKFLDNNENKLDDYNSQEWIALNRALQSNKSPFKNLLLQLETKPKNYVSLKRSSFRLKAFQQNFGLSGFFKSLQGMQLRSCLVDQKWKNATPKIAQLAAEGDMQTLELMLASKSSQDRELCLALIYAVINSREKVIELLVKKGVKVDCQDADGNTALMFAAANGNLRSVLYLLTFAQDINISNAQGQTALMLAAMNEHFDIVRTLIHKGANVNCADHCGNTPLIASTIRGDFNSVMFFCRNGANVNLANAKGNTPLIYAVISRDDTILSLLLEKKPNLDHQNLSGNSALIIAAMHGNLTAVQTLLGYGASTDLKNLQRHDALECAEKAGHDEIVRVLRKKISSIFAATSIKFSHYERINLKTSPPKKVG